jgi:hypothetical protein
MTEFILGKVKDIDTLNKLILVDGGEYGELIVYDKKGSRKNCNVIVMLRDIIYNGIKYSGMKYYGKTQGLKVYVESDDIDSVAIDFRKINISKRGLSMN